MSVQERFRAISQLNADTADPFLNQCGAYLKPENITQLEIPLGDTTILASDYYCTLFQYVDRHSLKTLPFTVLPPNSVSGTSNENCKLYLNYLEQDKTKKTINPLYLYNIKYPDEQIIPTDNFFANTNIRFYPSVNPELSSYVLSTNVLSTEITTLGIYSLTGLTSIQGGMFGKGFAKADIQYIPSSFKLHDNITSIGNLFYNQVKLRQIKRIV